MRMNARILAWACLALVLLATVSAEVSQVRLSTVRINGENASNESVVLKGDTRATVQVDFWSTRDLDDVRVEAFLSPSGEVSSAVLDMEEELIYSQRLSVQVPDEPGDYDLVVHIQHDNTSYVRRYPLMVERQEHGLVVQTIEFNPEVAQGGRSLGVHVVVLNDGSSRERVRVQATLLGEQQQSWIDVDRGRTGSATLYFDIPCSADSAEMKGIIEYGLKRDIFERRFDVEPSAECGAGGLVLPGTERAIVSIPDPLDASAGGAAVYNLQIQNLGSSVRSYYLDIAGLSWAQYSVSPAPLVLVQPGETVNVAISVMPRDDAPLGLQTFSIDVRSGDRIVQQVTLAANVLAAGSEPGDYGDGITANVIKRGSSSAVDLKSVGEVLLTLLVTIAVIVLGVMYLGSRPKPQAEEKESIFYEKIYGEE